VKRPSAVIGSSPIMPIRRRVHRRRCPWRAMRPTGCRRADAPDREHQVVAGRKQQREVDQDSARPIASARMPMKPPNTETTVVRPIAVPASPRFASGYPSERRRDRRGRAGDVEQDRTARAAVDAAQVDPAISASASLTCHCERERDQDRHGHRHDRPGIAPM